MKVTVSSSEQATGQLSAANLDQAVRYLREIGVAIVEGAIPRETVSEVHEAYVKKVHGRRKLLYPPLEPPFVDHEIIANPFALQVLEVVLGKKIGWALFNARRGQAGGGTDPEGSGGDIHRDGAHLFPELPIPLPASGICMDIPLIDFNEVNGAIRVFPGTHLVVDDPPTDIRNLPKRAQQFPSTQLATPAGSIILRDMRLWHSAMPNHTSEDRPWLTSLYVRVFQHAHERMYIPPEIKQGLPKHARRLLRTAISPVVEHEQLVKLASSPN